MTRIEHFICPSLCGCVIRRTHTWTPKEIPDDHPMAGYLRLYVEERQLLTSVTSTNETLARCGDPAHQHANADDHWNEIQHIHGNAHTVGTCKCRFPVWFDARHPEDTRTLTLVLNPALTHACEDHQHLALDIDRHHKTAMRDAHAAASVVAGLAASEAADAHATALSALAEHTAHAVAAATAFLENAPTPDAFATAVQAHLHKHLAEVAAGETSKILEDAQAYHRHTSAMTAQFDAAVTARG